MPRDKKLGKVVEFFLQQNGFEQQAAETLRRALDEVIDGMRTGRWAVAALEKTEKTYIGTKVEILFKFDFELPDGEKLDAAIRGAEVDIKCTVLNDWMIPAEAMGEICLLVKIDDTKSRFSIGLIRVTPGVLRAGLNRDRKGSLSAKGKESIRWLVRDGALPVSFLATLDEQVRKQIFSHPSGQLRIDELFRLAQGKIIPRVAIETVARQKDPMKRVRDTRKRLAREGILVLGHQDGDPERAKSRGYAAPKKGEMIAVPKHM
ncbi:MAG: restriction endonuclease [Opitutae bacterium]|nr:restriction endonuclease [Opitutae bacterium]